MIARRLLLVLGAAAAFAFAKNAEDYFHGASYKYVEGKRQDARLEVEEGLRRFPGDARLQSLAEQLKDLDDKHKNPQGGGEGDKDKDKNKDGKKDPKKDPDKKNEDEKKDDGKDKGKEDEKKPPRDEPSDEGKDPKNENGRNPAGGKPGEMSRDEASRLLNSFAEDEKKEQRERQKLMLKRLETEQDW